jgi:uncharacterized tellurite resistance protein B-like protein
MFGFSKTFLSHWTGDAKPPQARDYNRWLLTAALLTRVATIQNEMSEVRRRAIYTALQSNFRLDDRSVVRVLEEAAAANRNAIDLYHFTRQLDKILDDRGRNQIVRMMWEVVYADGHANEFDTNVIWRAADLLGVSSRQRVELRQLVSADSASLAQDRGVLPQLAVLSTATGK